jgi:hypothetical protein
LSSPALQPIAQDDEMLDQGGEAMPAEGVVAQVSEADLDAAMAAVVGKLQGIADKQVQLKQAVEQRWLDDLRQFHGRYDVNTENALKLAEKSKLFVNLTRAKVNSWEARLTDLLFPTDDKNWGIRPTPAPHLSAQVSAHLAAVKEAEAHATQAHQGGDPATGAAIAQQGTDAAQKGASIQDAIEENAKRCALMESEIDTQLKDCDYNIRSRDVIRDAIKLGTGVMKGPVTSQKLRRSWTQAPANSNAAPAAVTDQLGAAAPGASEAASAPYTPAQGTADSAPTDLRPWKAPAAPAQDVSPTAPGTAYVLNQNPDPAPEFLWVDPWSFFPDMSARTPDEAEFSFERHLWNAKQLRKAVKTCGLNPKAVAELLRANPTTTIPTYWAQLREVTSNSSIIGMEARYQVWEFHGVLEDEDLAVIAAITGKTEVLDFVTDNPLLEVPVIIWFCQGHLLKFAPYPLDSCDSLYSVVNFEPDDTSMFGFGVPYLQRDSQSALNGAWRMMMDNGALSVGPQVVMDTDQIKPADGSWTLRPMKVWFKSGTSLTKLPDSYKPFETYNVTSNQSQLQTIITLAKEFADEETNMPLIAAGGTDTHVTKTTGGMSMLMNSANVVFRRVVRNFDDSISAPNIRRMYDWNMQFSKREDIKGDYCVDTRGSSVLLVKEMQSQTLMSSLQNFSNHPILGPMLKQATLLRKLFQAQMIPADEAVKSDEVIAQEAEARATQSQQTPPPSAWDPETVKLKLASEEKIAAERNQTEVEIANTQQQTALMTLAQTHNMSLDDLQTKLQINQDNIAHRERTFAAELAMPKTAARIGGTEFGPVGGA